jgi:restriction endonuclease Mrr
MDRTKKIKVLNYHNFINLPTEDDRKPIYLEEGNLHELKPFVKELTLDQVIFINARCEVFRTGRLQFEESIEAEMFEELDIYKPEEVLRAHEIIDIIENPTKEKLERVVQIKDLNTIDLFRCLVVSYRNMGTQDISDRVVNVVEKRRNEIYLDPMAESKIKITKTKAEIDREAEQNALEKMISKQLQDAEKKAEEKYAKKIAELEAKLASESKEPKTAGRPKVEK